MSQNPSSHIIQVRDLGINNLMRAAVEDQIELLLELLNSKNKTQVKQLLLAKDHKGRTALDWARLANNEPAIAILVEAMKKQLYLDRLELMNEYSKSSNEILLSTNFQKSKELHVALHQLNQEVALRILTESEIIKDDVEALNERHFSDAFDDFGYTPLILAASQNLLEVVNFLLEFGVRIDHQNKYGHSALSIASACGHSSVVRLLLFRGANFHLTTPEGFTCLHFSCMYGKTHVLEVILAFLKERFALHRATHPKYDPLRWTSYCDSFEDFLNIRSRDGRRAIDLCQDSNQNIQSQNQLVTSYLSVALPRQGPVAQYMQSRGEGPALDLAASLNPHPNLSLTLSINGKYPGESIPSLLEVSQHLNNSLSLPHIQGEFLISEEDKLPGLCRPCSEPSPSSSLLQSSDHELEDNPSVDGLVDVYPLSDLREAENDSREQRIFKVHSLFAQARALIEEWRICAAREEEMARSTACWLGCGFKDRIEKMLEHISLLCPHRTQECPHCAQMIMHKDYQFHVKKGCRKRPVACPNAWFGCRELIPFEYVDTHLNLRCPLRMALCRLNCGREVPFSKRVEHELHHCKMRLIACEFCHTSLRSRDMKDHLQLTCSEHYIKCRQGCGENFKAKDLEKHELEVCYQECKWRCGERIKPIQTRVMHELGVCIKRPVQCKFQCGVQGLIAKYKVDHESQQCLLASTRCPNGCGLTKLLKRDLPVHLDIRTGLCSERLLRCPHNYVGWKVSLLENQSEVGLVLKYQRDKGDDRLYIKFPNKSIWIGLRTSALLLIEKAKGENLKKNQHLNEKFVCGWIIASQLSEHLERTCRFRSVLLISKTNEEAQTITSSSSNHPVFPGQSVPFHQSIEAATEISKFDSFLEPSSTTEICKYCNQVVDSEPYLLREHHSKCGFYQVRCSLGCGTVLSRHLMAHHQLTCNKRFVTCPLCNDDQLWAEELEAHIQDTCPLRPFECQLGCGVAGLTFQSEKEHRLNSCEYRMMTCSCGEEMQIRFHDRHMNDCEDRLLLCPQGCGLSFMDRDMDEHIEFKCDNRHIFQMRRIYCPVGCGAQHPACDMTEHVCYHCPRRLLDCPLGCGDSVRFDKTQIHLFYCPKRTFSCEPGMSCCEQVFYKWFYKAPDPSESENDELAVQKSSAYMEEGKLVMYSRIRSHACVRHGVTPLMHSVRFNNMALAEFLIKQTECYGLEVESAQGDTALSLACRFGRVKFVELLVQNGADVNHESVTGKTPLIEASRAPVENASIVDFLLQAGGIAALKTAKHGRTALDWAKKMGYEDTYRILDIMAQVQSQIRTIFLAISTGDNKMIRNLVTDGDLFDPNIDINAYAEMNKNISICKQAHKESEILKKRLAIIETQIESASEDLKKATDQLTEVNQHMISLLEKRDLLSRNYSSHCSNYDVIVRGLVCSDLEEMVRLKSPSESLRIAAFAFGITFGYLSPKDWSREDFDMRHASDWWPLLIPAFTNSEDTTALLKGFSFNYFFAVGMDEIRSFVLFLSAQLEASLRTDLSSDLHSMLPSRIINHLEIYNFEEPPSDPQLRSQSQSPRKSPKISKAKTRLISKTESSSSNEIVLVEELPLRPVSRPTRLPPPTPEASILVPIKDEDWDSDADDAGGGEWVKGEWKPISKRKDRWWERERITLDDLRRRAEEEAQRKAKLHDQMIGKGRNSNKLVVLGGTVPNPSRPVSAHHDSSSEFKRSEERWKESPPLGQFLQVMLVMMRSLTDLENIKDKVLEARERVVVCGQMQVERKTVHSQAALVHDRALRDRHSVESEIMRQMKLENFTTKRAQMFKRRMRIARLLNQITASGHTPISWAASYGNFEAVDLLLLHGSSTGYTSRLMHFSATYLQMSYRMYALRCKASAQRQREKEDASLLISSGEGPSELSSSGIMERIDKIKVRRELVLKSMRTQRLKMRFPIPEAAYTGKWEVIKRIQQRKAMHLNFTGTWVLPSAPFPYSRKHIPYDPKRKKSPLDAVIAMGMNDLAAGCYLEKSGWVPPNHPQEPFGELQAELSLMLAQISQNREAFHAERRRIRLVVNERKNRKLGEVEMVAAIKRRDFKKCVWLAENASVFIDFESPNGYTALIAAAEETVTPDKTDWTINNDGKKCLAVEFLLDRFYYRPGINVEASTNLTALMKAASLNRYHVIQALLDRGADIDLQNRLGRTALHFAVEANAMQALQVLVERGANITLKDNQGMNPFELSEALMLADPVRLLGQLANGFLGRMRWTIGEIQDAVSCPIGCGERLFQYQVEEHCKNCQYREAPCPLGCTVQRMMLREIEEHVRDLCIYRAENCSFCHLEYRHCEKQLHLDTKCLHRSVPCELGCGNNIKVVEMPRHLRICTSRPAVCPLNCGASGLTMENSFEHVKKHCQNRRILCPNKCYKWVVVRNLSQHTNEVCTNRQSPCKFCSELIFARDLKEHLSVCTLRGELCPAKCREYVLESNKKHHLAYECVNRFVPCDLRCGLKVRVRDMAKHTSDLCEGRPVPCPNGCVPDREKSISEQDPCCFPARFIKQHSEMECYRRRLSCVQCMEGVPANEMEEHVRSSCPARPVPCRQVGCLKVVPLRERESHERHQCRFRFIPCSQGCGEQVVFLHSGKHLLFQCPMRYVECPLRCGMKLRHRLMFSHMESDCPRRHAYRDMKYTDNDEYSQLALSQPSPGHSESPVSTLSPPPSSPLSPSKSRKRMTNVQSFIDGLGKSTFNSISHRLSTLENEKDMLLSSSKMLSSSKVASVVETTFTKQTK